MSSDADSPMRTPARRSPTLDATEIALDAAELWRLSKLSARPAVKDAILKLYSDIGARLAHAQQAIGEASPPTSARKRKQQHDSPVADVTKRERIAPASPSVTEMVLEGPKETPKAAKRTASTRAQLTPLTKKARDAQRKARKRAAQEFLINYATAAMSDKDKEREFAAFCSDELKKTSLRSLVAGVTRNDGDFKWLSVRGDGLRALVIEAAKTLLKSPILVASFSKRGTPSRTRAAKGASAADGEDKKKGGADGEAGAAAAPQPTQPRAPTGIAPGTPAGVALAVASAQYYDDDEEEASGAESDGDVVEFRSDFARHDESEEDEEEEEEEEEEDEEEEAASPTRNGPTAASRMPHRSLVYSSPIHTK